MKPYGPGLFPVVIFCFSTLLAGPSLAEQGQEAILKQIEASRALGQERWRELIDLNMQLSDDEAENFWPIYDDYNAEMIRLNDRVLELIKHFADSYNNNNLTDETAKKLINENFAIQNQKLKIQEKYNKKFQKALPPKRVMRFIQIDNKLNALVDASLALQIPLAE